MKLDHFMLTMMFSLAILVVAIVIILIPGPSHVCADLSKCREGDIAKVAIGDVSARCSFKHSIVPVDEGTVFCLVVKRRSAR